MRGERAKRTTIEPFFSTGFVVDPQHSSSHYWLAIISLAVTYNLLFIPARYSFADLDQQFRVLWISLDYFFDLVYLVDMFVQSRTGQPEGKREKRQSYHCLMHSRLLQPRSLRSQSSSPVTKILLIPSILCS